MFGSKFVRRTETEVSSVELAYFLDCFFFELFFDTPLPRSGDAFLDSLKFALPDCVPFPCLPPEAAVLFACFGLGGVCGGVFGGGFFKAGLRVVASCFLFVDGAPLGVLAVAPRFLFFAGFFELSAGVIDRASFCFRSLICVWSWRC